MRLKLLVAAIPLMLALGGCVVHFPLQENSPSLAGQDESTSSSANMGMAPTEPNTHDPIKGNSTNTPDLPQ
jgi:hypothetical protein